MMAVSACTGRGLYVCFTWGVASRGGSNKNGIKVNGNWKWKIIEFEYKTTPTYIHLQNVCIVLGWKCSKIIVNVNNVKCWCRNLTCGVRSISALKF